MRMSEEEYQSALARLKTKSKAQRQDPQVSQSPAVKARGTPVIGPSGMNKTETRYLQEKILPRVKAGEIVSYHFDKVKRNLSVEGETCWYKPDWEIMLSCGQIEYHEIKGGYIREDAAIKFKAAMSQYPMFNWLMWQYKGGEWLLVKDSRRLERFDISCAG